jgi:3-polyprenyl-4-hydroxybenzoate decarboxylase
VSRERALAHTNSRKNPGLARLKRLAANDIIAHFLKHKELAEIEKRIKAIEDRLESRG